MSILYSDNFNRSNVDPIGGNWTTVTGFSDLQISSNAVALTERDPLKCAAYWNANTIQPDQYAQVTQRYDEREADIWPIVRCSASSGTFYTLDTSGYISKYVNGVMSHVGTSLFTYADYANGSGTTWKLAISGNTLYLYVDGTFLGSRTDSSSPITSGQPGIYIWAGATSNPILDDWSCGNQEVVKVVDPDMGSGYHYDSLYDWEAAQQGDLTGARDEIAIAKCRSTGGSADTTAVTIDGFTTSATQYIKIWTDPTENYRHQGIWSNSKYRIAITNENNTLTIADNYVKIDGLQVSSTTGNYQYITVIRVQSCTGVTISSNIVKKGHATSQLCDGMITLSSSVGPHYIYNNIVYGFDETNCTGITVSHDTGTASTFVNNTICNCTTPLSGDYGCISNPRNNLFYNNTNSPVFNTPVSKGDYNATDAASIFYGDSGSTNTHDRVSQTFTFVDSANGDFHLASNDAGAKGYGTNLYNDASLAFQTDIMGNDRGGALATVWDIGAHEYTAGTVTKVVDPDAGTGHDYHSLSDWEAGEQKSLVNNGEIAVAKCRCTGGTADTTAVTIEGWTTSATQYIKIWTDTSENYRHNGTPQDTGNKYRIKFTNGSSIVSILEENIVFDGIQVFSAKTDISNYYPFWYNSNADYNTTIKNSIFKGISNGYTGEYYGVEIYSDGGGGGTYYVYNNICIGFDGGVYCSAVGMGKPTGTMYSYNNTAIGCTHGFEFYDGTFIVKNCLASGSSVADFLNYSTNVTCYNCASSDATADDHGGSGNRVSQTFTFVNAGANDYHLASNDAGAKGYGVSDPGSGLFSDDIDGQTRSGAWDIGADQYVAEAPSIEYVQHKYGYTGNPLAVAFDSNVTAGSLIIVAVNTSGSGNTFTVTDNHSQVYSYFNVMSNADAGSSQIFYFPNAAAGATTVTVTGSTQDPRVSIYEFSGIALTSPVDNSGQESGQLDNSAPYTPHVDFSTTQADTLLFTAISSYNNSAAFSAGSLISHVIAECNGFGTGYEIVTTSGSKEIGLTANGADYFNVQSVAFKKGSNITVILTGTAIASITEADMVTGGKTIIITLTGDTWVVLS